MTIRVKIEIDAGQPGPVFVSNTYASGLRSPGPARKVNPGESVELYVYHGYNVTITEADPDAPPAGS